MYSIPSLQLGVVGLSPPSIIGGLVMGKVFLIPECPECKLLFIPDHAILIIND